MAYENVMKKEFNKVSTKELLTSFEEDGSNSGNH